MCQVIEVAGRQLRHAGGPRAAARKTRNCDEIAVVGADGVRRGVLVQPEMIEELS